MSKSYNILKNLFRKKDISKAVEQVENSKHKLKRTLGAFDLTMLGIGAIIGAGIFTLSGTAAAGSETHLGAGPALIISFLISGGICAITALCYAEFVTMIPVTGSAYTYAYATFGEIVAWLIGWILIFEYTVGNITVVCGLTGYFLELIQGFDHILPHWLTHPPYWLIFDYQTALSMYTKTGITPDFPILFGFLPVSINLPAIIVICIITSLLYIGIKESARTAAVMVLLKAIVIIAFIIVGVFYVKPDNWVPFMPNGFPGVFMGAFLVFFAYIGFDSVATAAEETKNPHKNLPLGILYSLAFCTVIYILVALVLTGMVPFNEINTHAPIAAAMSYVGQNWISGAIALGAVTGLFSVALVEQLAVTRILFAISRDGLLPKTLSKLHTKFKTPHVITIILGCVTIFGTLFLDINKAAELCNIGTLTAFSLVCIGIIVLRYKDPDRKRPFKVPFTPILPGIGALGGIGLICYSLFNPETPLEHARYVYTVWITIGIIVYIFFSRKNSLLAKNN